MRVLSPTLHGVLDYALAIAFLVVPRMFDFSYAPRMLAYIIGVVYLGASLLTKYPLGALKLIPFPVHGLIESIMAVSWIMAPWLFGFADDAAARTFFIVAGVGLLVVAALTDYWVTGTTHFEGPERRRHMIDRRQRWIAVRHDRRAGARDRRSGGYRMA